MKTGPLNESEVEWLDDILSKYAVEGTIMDVAELDGLLTVPFSPGRRRLNPRSGCLLSGAERITCRAGPTIASGIVL